MRIRSVAIAAVLVRVLGGCTYLETQLQRKPAADTRIRLDERERRYLHPGEFADYTCRADLLLVCEGTGSSKHSCTCMPR